MTDTRGEAIRQMGSEPLEYGEPVGPRKRGRPPLDRTKGRLNATVDADLLEQLQAEAEAQETSVSQQLNDILAKRYERN